MALINCPECGEKISSNAKQCIHCGCKFTACPECGNVSVGEFSVCPACGYELKKTNSFSKSVAIDGAEDSSSHLNKDDPLAKWKKSSIADNTVLKVLKVVEISAHILATALLVVAVILFVVWKGSNAWDKLAGLTKLKSSLNCLVAFACIFEIFDMIIGYVKESFIKLRCASWIKSKHNFDAVAYIRDYDSFVGSAQDEEELSLFIEAAYISETQKGTGAIYAGIILRLVLAVAFWTCVGVAIMQNFTELIRISSIEGVKFEFKYTALIGAAVSLVLFISAALITELQYDKGYRAWLNQTFPDWLDQSKK